MIAHTGIEINQLAMLIWMVLGVYTIGLPLWYMVSALASHFITSGKKIYVPLSSKLNRFTVMSMVEYEYKQNRIETWDTSTWIVGGLILHILFGTLAAALVAYGLSYALLYVPTVVFIVVGVAIGLLFAARCIYSLHERYETHIRELHEKKG